VPVFVLRVEEAAERLDRYLAERLPELSRSQVQRLIREGAVLVNGEPSRASHIPAPGDLIRVEAPDPQITTPAPEAIPLTVVYEDAYLLVLDKPPGLVVHPASGHHSGTVVNALLAHRPDIAAADLDPQRPGIVHRLDRDTSGLLVVATTREVQAALQAACRGREVEKEYVALVHGRVEPEAAAIEAPIGRDPHNRQRMAVVPEGGRYALTRYQVLEYLPDSTLLTLRPATGRTHQIRVHLASIGHPVVGDRTYGPRRGQPQAPRQLLHASALRFTHPVTQQPVVIESPLPPDLQRVLERLRARR